MTKNSSSMIIKSVDDKYARKEAKHIVQPRKEFISVSIDPLKKRSGGPKIS